jgi:phage regulator Rha-like protein
MSALRLVETRGQRAWTTSEIVADGCGIRHKNLLAMLRKYAGEFSELGLLAFETRPRLPGQHGGGETEYAVLNEDQATFAITLFRNTPVVLRFKLALVKAFRRALDQIARDFANPPRRDILTAKRASNRPMLDALVEAREEAGKATDERHFMCEARLCNWALTGRFEKLDERTLSNADAALLEQVRDRNRALLLAGLDYATRKGRLNAYALRQRTRLIGIDRTESKERQSLAIEPMQMAG